MTDRRPRPVVLCILDGWGWRVQRDDNAIALANTPIWNRLLDMCPHALLATSGADVGLPAGQMGNSEVGHTNIGAGRIVLQDLPRIDRAIADGSLAANETLADFAKGLRQTGGTAHVLGLMSDGGVHSHQDHIAALVRVLADRGLPVRVHGFLDGRDTPPSSALNFVARFEAAIADAPNAAIATLGGRFWGMDRDKRWRRVQRAHDCLVQGTGEQAPTAEAAIRAAYDRDETDEFVHPTAINGYGGMADGDGLLMANFRADRAREILTALVDPDFDGFARSRQVDFAARAGMVSYSEALDPFLPALFPPENLPDVFGAVIAEAGLRQLRIAETEKYAHVTFFFNGGAERVFAGEERILVPSPQVATYDLQPEMSAHEVTDRLVAAIDSDRFDVIVVNYANTDMVGHTGQIDAAIQAVTTVDACLGRLRDAVHRAGGALLVTADHGNAETMRDDTTGAPHTAHTTNPVPLVLATGPGNFRLRDGRLADLAPTLLALLGLPRPVAMTGTSLLMPADQQTDAPGAMA